MPNDETVPIEVDKLLCYSNENFTAAIVTELSSFRITKEIIQKMPCFPTYLELAMLSRAAYKDVENANNFSEEDLPPDWKVLTSARSGSGGYVGILYLNPNKQLLVLAHRGTDSTDHIITCINGVILNKFDRQIHSAITFADTVNSTITKLNEEHKNIKLLLSFTGHSLGGWLAQITAFSSKYLTKVNSHFQLQVLEDKYLQIHTVSFDNPGCKDMLAKLENMYTRYRYDKTISTDSLDITCILGAPNFVNCFRQHVGTIFRECYDIPYTWRLETPYLYAKEVHKLKHFISALENKQSKLKRVLNWPLLKVNSRKEFKRFFKIGKFENNYHPDKEALAAAGHKVKYRCTNFDGKFCPLNIFSKSETRFIKWVYIAKRTAPQIPEIAHFPDFNDVMAKNNVIIKCKSADDLCSFIHCVKQMFRWNFSKVQSIIDMIKVPLPFHKCLLLQESQTYRTNIHNIDDYRFHDFMKLKEFMNSIEKKVFHVNCEISPEIAVAVLLNMIGSDYLETCSHKEYAILSWSWLCELKTDLSIAGSHLIALKDFKVIIIDFSQQQELSDTESSLLKEILGSLQNIPTKLIIFTKNESTTFDCMREISPEQMVFFAFDNSFINHLTNSSRKKLLFHKIYLNSGNSKIPLGDILLTNENEIDLVVENLEKELGFKYLINSLSTFVDTVQENKRKIQISSGIDAQYVQVEAHDIIISHEDFLIQACENLAAYFVTSCTEQQNSNNQTANLNNVTYSVSDVDDNHFEDFKYFCHQNVKSVAYWYDYILEENCFHLKYIYNEKICVPRFLIPRNTVKNTINQEFSQCTDYFIFAGFEKYGEISETDSKPYNVYVIPSYEDTEIIFQQLKQEKVNVHLFEKKKNDDKTYIAWCNSTNSLNCLSEHISEGQPISEDKFARTFQNRIVIISDEPATGKSSVLTTLAEKLNSDLVMRVNLGSCQKAVEDLPRNFEFEEIVKFIVQNSSCNLTQSPDGNKLLKFVLEHKTRKPVYLILDEFDEIKDIKQEGPLLEKMLKFVEMVLKKTDVHVWIGVRRHLQNILEQRFCVFSASLQEIATEEQKQFICEYWESLAYTDNRITERNFKEIADSLVENAVDFFTTKQTNPIGSPLLMKLLAAVFYHTITKESSDLQGNDFRFGTLIKSFLDLKLDIYISEKLGCMFKYNDGNCIPWYKDCLIQKHEYLAIQSMFRKWHTKFFIEFQDPEFNDTLEYLRIGILTAVSLTGTPRFIHQIFEEYYCASLFLKRLKTGNDQAKELTLDFLFTRILIQLRYKTIRCFIDDNLSDLLSRNDTNTYRTFSEWISKLWIRQPGSFFNHLHETALHVVMEENLQNLTTLLIKCCTYDAAGPLYTLLSSRNLEEETSLNIALKSGHIHFIELYKQIFQTCSIEACEEVFLSAFYKIPTEILTTNLNYAENYFSAVDNPSSMSNIFIDIKLKQKYIEETFEVVKSGDMEKIHKVFQEVGNKQFRHYLARSFEIENEQNIHLITLASKLFENRTEVVEFLISEYKSLLHCEVPKYRGRNKVVGKLHHTIQALTKHTRLPELKVLARELGLIGEAESPSPFSSFGGMKGL